MPGRPRWAELVPELVVDEVAELVEEAERDPAVPPRDAQVDRFAVAEAVAAALARRRGRTDRHRLEIGVEAVERPGDGKRPRELGVERAPARQLEKLR